MKRLQKEAKIGVFKTLFAKGTGRERKAPMGIWVFASHTAQYPWSVYGQSQSFLIDNSDPLHI